MSASYRQIFKSTAFVGGAQVIGILFGILKNKILAVLLGPAGVGLAGLYSSVTGLVGTVSGLGIPMGGVREIAESAGQGDERRIGVTLATLKAVSWISGLLGMLFIIAFAGPISHLTFGDRSHFWGLWVVALVVLLEGVGARQKAVLQGMRRIQELSVCQVIGAIGGTVAALPAVLFFGQRGVAGFLVIGSLCGVLASWWFARQIPVLRVKLDRTEFLAVLRGLLGIGVAAVVTGFMTMAVNYTARMLVSRELGMDSVGLFQATLTLSSTYVGVILSAMGTDYFPRLAAVAGDRGAFNRVVNEQTEMGVVFALPGILATLVLAPWVLQIVYSKAFMPAADVIRWQILGDALKVVCWPMGFIALAKGRGVLFVIFEGSYALLQILLLHICVQWRGFEGTGVAFFLLSIAYIPGILILSGKLSSFSWSGSCFRTLLVATTITAGVFLLARYGEPSISAPIGVVVTAIASLWSLKRLQALLGQDYFRNAWGRFVGRFRKTPQAAVE